MGNLGNEKAAGRQAGGLGAAVVLTVRPVRARAAAKGRADNRLTGWNRVAYGRWYAQSAAATQGGARKRAAGAERGWRRGRMRGLLSTLRASHLAVSNPPDTMLASLPRGTWWLLALVALIAWFAALDIRKLQHPDEGRYAEIAREMAVSGDWVTPRLNDLKYFEKPPLQYWLGAATFDALGVNEWTARLPSAIAGFLAVIAVGFTAARLAGADAGAYAALVLAGTRVARRPRALADARCGPLVLARHRAVRVPARAAAGALAVRAAQLDAAWRTRRPRARR